MFKFIKNWRLRQFRKKATLAYLNNPIYSGDFVRTPENDAVYINAIVKNALSNNPQGAK